MMLDEARCRRIIAEALPVLPLRSVRYFAAGWDYELWEVNDELLFRFPLREECAVVLPAEVALLRDLSSRVSVRVPQPYLFAGSASFAMPFSMYGKLPGMPLCEIEPDGEGRAGLARQLGQFLTELHSYPIPRAKHLGVPVRIGPRWRGRYLILHERVKSQIYPLLAADDVAELEAFWEDFLGREQYFQFAPALIHGDLDQAHILVGPNGVTLSGVIDFGDMRVGDPALDFAGFEPPFREKILANYGLSVDPTLLERADIYRRRISPLYGLLYGLENALSALAERGLSEIRAAIGSP